MIRTNLLLCGASALAVSAFLVVPLFATTNEPRSALSIEQANAAIEAVAAREVGAEPTRLDAGSNMSPSAGASLPATPAPIRTLDVNDLPYIRSDSFGVLLRAGQLSTTSRNSPVWFFVQTVQVPSAYQHCLRGYRWVERAELRLTVQGSPSVHPLQRLADGTLAVAIAPSVLASAQSGRLLGWEAGANPNDDDAAILDVAQ